MLCFVRTSHPIVYTTWKIKYVYLVFPQPGGPQKIKLGRELGGACNNDDHMSEKSWPIKSLRTLGLINSAKGALEGLVTVFVGFKSSFFDFLWNRFEDSIELLIDRFMAVDFVWLGLLLFSPVQLDAWTSREDFGNVSKHKGHWFIFFWKKKISKYNLVHINGRFDVLFFPSWIDAIWSSNLEFRATFFAQLNIHFHINYKQICLHRE